MLREGGLKETSDFIIYRKLLNEVDGIMKPSEMMKKVMYDIPLDVSTCRKPFEYTELTFGGHVYCCCPSWVNTSFGSMSTDSLESIWESNVAKIFRLSIMNRTFSFCNDSVCPHLYKKTAREKEIDDEEEDLSLREMENEYKYPKSVLISIDQRCNLKCPQCRDDFFKLSKIDESLMKLWLWRIRTSSWIEASPLMLAGGGECFFSPIYRDLLYKTNEKRKEVYLLTNGLLLTENEIEKVIQKYEKIYLDISVDAATAQTYNRVRGGTSEGYVRI